MLATGEPVALVMGLMLHHIADLEQTRDIMRKYVAALPSGSYLALTHACNPGDGSPLALMASELIEKVKTTFPTLRFRTVEEISSLFAGAEILPPGLVTTVDWHPPDEREPDHEPGDPTVRHLIYGAVARKP
jgi:hypothetical protein